MSEDRKKPLWPWIVTLLIGLPVLYALSVGPVFSITGHEVLLGDEDPVDCFYEPLFWACRSPRANAWLWWYIRFWPGPYFGPFAESIPGTW